ncbi:MAG: hypothetical protein OXH73_04020 [Caldilineaceae bacterium]|nr:hypothetical protein [Caldilineaceae bacterium]
MSTPELRERVATLEEQAKSLATREDLLRVQREIEENFDERFLQIDTSASQLHESISELRDEVRSAAQKAENKLLKILIVAILAVPPLVDKGIEKLWP